MTPFSYRPSELDTGVSFHVQDDQGTMTMNLETISIGCCMMLAHRCEPKESKRDGGRSPDLDRSDDLARSCRWDIPGRDIVGCIRPRADSSAAGWHWNSVAAAPPRGISGFS
jgi:hypothetical protein